MRLNSFFSSSCALCSRSDRVQAGPQVDDVFGFGVGHRCHSGHAAVGDPAQLDRRDFNDQVIVAHARHGEGLFMAALRRQLRRRRLQIRLREYDLITEITKRSPAVGGSAPSGTEDDT